MNIINLMKGPSKDILSSRIAFTNQTCDNTSGSILRVQRVTQFLPNRVVLLPQREKLQNNCIILVLQSMEESRQGSMCGWPRGRSFWCWACVSSPGIMSSHREGLTGFKFYEVALFEFVTSDWVSAIFSDILGYKPAFVDMTRLDGDDGILGWFAWNCTENHFTEKTTARLRFLRPRHPCWLVFTFSFHHVRETTTARPRYSRLS